MGVVPAVVGALIIGLVVWIGLRDDQADGRLDRGLPDSAPSVAASGGKCAPKASLEPPCGAWWGAYVPYTADGSLTDAVYAFEKKIGRKLDLVYTYHDMSGTELDGELLTPDERELGKERLLMLAWEAGIWSEPHHEDGTGKRLSWNDIASGRYDEELIDPQARRMKQYGKRIFFSFDQEADARLSEEAGTPGEYIAAYRHIHDRFKKLGVDNAVWVWTVSGDLAGKDEMKALYPGDTYVDWIGMDQYNDFLCRKGTGWKDFRESQQPSYEWLRSHVSSNKPVMLAEFGTAPDPADRDRQRDWYATIPGVARSLPGVKALVQSNRSVPGRNCDHTVGKGPALAGYREAGRDTWFRQPLPGRQGPPGRIDRGRGAGAGSSGD